MNQPHRRTEAHENTSVRSSNQGVNTGESNHAPRSLIDRPEVERVGEGGAVSKGDRQASETSQDAPRVSPHAPNDHFTMLEEYEVRTAWVYAPKRGTHRRQ